MPRCSYLHCIVLVNEMAEVALWCVGLVGLAISYVLSMTGLLNGVVTYFTETEKQMVSVERIDQYISDVPEELQCESIQVWLWLLWNTS